MNKSTTSPNSDVSRASHFERARIRTLAAELEKVQKKTFTKWVNSCLSRVGLNIDNLYSDLCDGTVLLRLLEVLSGEKLPKPARGRMRIHLIQNLNAVLKFLIHKHVKLENIGAHDIVDGNQRIILGLIWTIILRFQIQDIRIEGETTESTEKRSAKDALLVWCKLKTANYTNVRVTNFTSSWRNGLAFNALIHKHRPDVVDYDRLSPDNALENLRLAFTVADECFGIAPLLDAEDICVENPDEKSIMTYVASYYQSFSKLKAENVVERRIWKVMNCIMDLEKMMQEYDTLASNLLKWIRAMIVILSDRQFENNLDGVQRQLSEFKTYRTVDKPLRYLEKGTLEEKFFTIQSKLRSNNRKGFIPVADKTISDINKSWEQLENAEHDREQALREEIIRQERLERLADKFTKKAEMRVQWICDSVRLVDNDIFGDSGSSVSAALKKQEAFEADVYEYQKRIRAMEDLVQELKIGNYHAIQKIQDKRDKVIILWNELLELIKIREGKVSQHVELHDHIQELEDFMGWSRDVKNSLESEDYGLELHDVEDLLQKNLILENEILAQEEPLTRALLEAENFKAPSKEDGVNFFNSNPMNDLLKERINSLSRLYDQISELLYIRKTRLEDSRQLLQFYQNVDDELDWMKGKNQSLSLTDLTKATDCSYVIHKLRSHQALEAEVNNNETLLRNIIDTGNQLSKNNNYDSSMILSKINNLASAWNNLVDSMSKRKDRIAEILSMQQFLSEADYLEGQISLHTGLLSVDQNRIDEDNIDSLLKHHANLEFEVENYKDQLHLLDNMADDLNPNDQSFEMALGKKAVITEKYQVLMAEVGYRREKLIAQQSLFRYLSEIDIVFSWIGDKEAVLFSFEPPTNLIEAELILQKFKGIERDIVTYQDRYNNTLKAGNDLAVQITDGNDEIANAQGELNEKWIRLLELHGLKKEELSKLLILLRLFYEVDEVKNWIADKGTGLSSCSYTTDPAAVLQMQRQINVIERETPAIEERIEDVESKRDALAEEQPDKLEIVNDKLDSLYEVWDDLRNLVRNQIATIGECSNIQKLMFDVEDLEDWLKFQLGQLSLETDGLNSLPDVEKLQAEHNELLEEFTNRKIILDRINSTAPMHYTGDAAGRRLEQRVEDINHDWNDLDSLCHKRKVLLQQIQQYLIFQRDCKYIEGILQKQDVFLAEVMTELGTSNKSANQLKNKDDQHLKRLDSCIQRVAQADQFAKLSVDDDHYAKESLMSKAATLSERVERNRGLFTEIAFRLDKAVHLQSFYQRCNELIDWINEKFNIISGDIVTDQAYISRLLQKHRTFEAELAATRDQKNVVNELGKSLVQDQPDARPEVEIHLTDIEDRWITLMDACSTRSQLLTDRYNEVQFIRIIDNLQAWMSDAENTLANMETCKDLASCNKSMTKLTSLESDIISRKDRLDQLEQQVQNFLDINHRGADDMQDLFESVSQRYAALQRPLKERRKLLEASRRMFQFYRDVDDELLWIEDKKQQLQSNETGNNLHEVQILRTVQQNIQNEIRVHEQIINEIFKSGSKVISDADSSADKIRHNTELLKEKWLELEICSREREAIIEQSATAHKLLFDTEEMEGWIMEKAAILITKDKPKDQIRAMSMMKHHELLEQSVKSYAQNIKSLHQSGQAFLDQSTIKSKEIVEALDVIDDSYNSLLILASERRNFIDELLRFYRYNSEVDEVEQWIKEREVFSKSKDYGSNLEQIQRIAETFHSWVVNTKNSGVSKVKEVNLIADQLIITGHPEAATICEWKSGINDLWNQLLETIQERTKNIENVATIRDHYAAGNDFLHRIRTKGQCLPDDLGNNFDSTECLLHRHSIVQSDVLGIELEYNNLQEYAAQLKVDFPNEKQAIDELHGKISDAWELLKDKCNWRKSQLEQTLDLFRLLLLVENHALWINDMYDDINSLEDPRYWLPSRFCSYSIGFLFKHIIREFIANSIVQLIRIIK
ncbi:uncharacterized protein TRIADDRAFT_32391 [Trichoplax adhaerens]|uniref:Calponin-homology (CH) domain-containing protein n=1 Tax=Trichoplax adhaerens TaxID=10228 RepID=B3SAU0_TRIAD|nr:hypothetical protein TRIADDRAFT_32391 [Trichoplax adhaerens]EDV20211.1 hypothetical protein TRIADDRAFT_32391 [Trichoplax adhaerens]|eukprot:XP_002117372.1 hypothetical protein TRIADDRAFT_32391 [Trichoplax adhaerens]